MHISFSDARPDLARPISSVDFAYAILTIRYKDKKQLWLLREIHNGRFKKKHFKILV